MTNPRTSGAAIPRMPALDGLRFLAALSVALFHLVAVAGWQTGTRVWGQPSREVFGDTAFNAASYGWVGVPLFFIISGFVISMSSWGRTAGQFAISRFVRLFPAYWACIIVTTTAVALYPVVFKPLAERAVLLNFTMLQDPLGVPRVDNVYWTLWIEMKFYLLFLLVVWRGLTYRRAVTFCLLWSVAAAWAGELKQPWLNAILMPGQSQYFIAGIALFLIYKFGSNLTLWLIVGFSWIMAMYYYVGNDWQKFNGQSYLPSSMLLTLFFCVMAVLAMGGWDWLRWRGLSTLGATTYPLYLLHYVVGLSLVHYLNRKLALPPPALLALVLTMLVTSAWLVHRLVERPLAPRLKRALSRPIGEGRHRQRPAEGMIDVTVPSQSVPSQSVPSQSVPSQASVSPALSPEPQPVVAVFEPRSGRERISEA